MNKECEKKEYYEQWLGSTSLIETLRNGMKECSF